MIPRTIGLLLRAPDKHGKPLVLIQRRAPTGDGRGSRELPGGWNLPGSWNLPGTEPRGDETPAETALRVAEQIGADPGKLRIRGERVDQPDGNASCVTVIADLREPGAVPSDRAAAWVPEAEVGGLNLHPAFGARWPALRAPEIGLLVDAANVVGSRPDGWWRDRAGAAERLLRNIAAAAPGVLALPGDGTRWVTRPVVVLEGAAKRAPDVPDLEVVRAPESGDDTIVDVARRGGDWVVVTADRGLRSRLPASARAVGPSILRSWLSPASS